MTQDQKITILVGVLGVIGTIVGTIGGVIAGYWLTTEHENKKEHRQTLSSLKAIRAELITVWGAYMKGPGKDLEKRIASLGEKNALGRYPSVSDSFFTVYSNNASILGKLGDDHLTESIILAMFPNIVA